MGACFLYLAIFATSPFSDFLKLKNFEGRTYINYSRAGETLTPDPAFLVESLLLSIIATLTAIHCNLSPDHEMVIVVFKHLAALVVTSVFSQRGFESLPLRHLRPVFKGL